MLARQALSGLSRILLRLKPDRIVVVGGPKVGKTTLAAAIKRDGVTVHGDEDLRGLEWSAGSAKATQWLYDPGPWICENVAMARALRKWLLVNTGSPADLVVVLKHPVADRSPGHITMAKGVETVWREVAEELQGRGTAIVAAKPLAAGPAWVGVNQPAP